MADYQCDGIGGYRHRLYDFLVLQSSCAGNKQVQYNAGNLAVALSVGPALGNRAGD